MSSLCRNRRHCHNRHNRRRRRAIHVVVRKAYRRRVGGGVVGVVYQSHWYTVVGSNWD